MHFRILFTAFLFSISLLSMRAQDNIIDEVIWVVGDEFILRSDVEQHKKYEGVSFQGDPNCVIPEQLAIQKLFLHQAQLDSIEVNESQVMGNVDLWINYVISQIGSVEKMEEYYQKNLAKLREERRVAIRDQMIIQQMQLKLVENIKSTPAQVRRFYNNLHEDSIPVVPAQVELQIISFQPQVSQEEIEDVKDRLRGYAERVNSGNTEFSVLARLYSEDPESSKRGGELGFRGKGVFDPEFANVAFNLTDPKRVSRVVESAYGFHIIQLIEKRGDRLNCRHILLTPKISADDEKKAIQRLDSITTLIRTGKMTFEQGVMFFSQDKNTAMNAGLMLNRKTQSSKFEYQDLPQEVAKVVYEMKVGEISVPFIMIDPTTNKQVVAVVKVKSKVENHKANMTDDYQLLTNYYEETEKEAFIKKWIAKKQKETYISIDPAWQNCPFEYPGWIKD